MNSFNDPYEGRIPLSTDGRAEEKREFFAHPYKRFRPEGFRDESHWGDHVLAIDGMVNVPVDMMYDSLNTCGFFCLSETPRNILMWSHYGDHHKVICIGFNASANNPFFGQAQKVNYLERMPVLYPWSDSQQKLDYLALTKYKDWGYEKEWRLFVVEGAGSIQHYPEDNLIEVLFGCRVEKDDIELVKGWLQEADLSPQLRQAKQKPSSFDLDLEIIGGTQ